jgi:predicted nucleic acid-binding protein
MRVYLDTTVITILLFERNNPSSRYAETVRLFDVLDANRFEAVVSLYALQELCAFCYGNFPAEQAPHVARLAFYELLGHEIQLVPLLTRMDRIILNRRFPLKDTSDQAHAATAYHHGCQAIITYDSHYDEIADRMLCVTAGEMLETLGE